MASQCLAFCQTLASQGMDFHFSLTINSNFSFSLDTRKIKGNSAVAKKRSSPSTQRRNARRREAFLKRKLNSGPLSPSAPDAPAEDKGQVQTRVPLLRFYSVFSIVCSSLLSLFCLTFVSILDWLMRGSSHRFQICLFSDKIVQTE